MNPQNPIIQEQAAEAIKLPLWKNVVEEMTAAGLEENKCWTLEYFTKGLMCEPNGPEFAFAIHYIRKALRRKGWAFASRNTGQQFFLRPRAENADVMLSMQREAINALREGLILGTTTPLETLNEEQRRRHEGVLEKIALRLALMNRKIPASLK